MLNFIELIVNKVDYAPEDLECIEPPFKEGLKMEYDKSKMENGQSLNNPWADVVWEDIREAWIKEHWDDARFEYGDDDDAKNTPAPIPGATTKEGSRWIGLQNGNL